MALRIKSNEANAKRQAPKGHHKFAVTVTAIRDSLGEFCNVGQTAILSKKLAQHYLDLGLIRVELPEFDDEDDAGKKEPNTGGDDDRKTPEPSDDDGAKVEAPSRKNRLQIRP